jgi:hypothetical protein
MVHGIAGIGRVLICSAVAWASQVVCAGDAVPTEGPPAAKIVSADPAVQLRYKFQPSQFFYYEVAGCVRYVAQQAGQSLETFQRNETSKHFRVVSVDDDGSALLEPIIDRIKMSGGRRDSEEVGDQTIIEFDSAQDKVVPTDFQSHKETIGKAMARFKYAMNGELLAVRVIAPDLSKTNAPPTDKADPKMSFLIPLPKEAITVGHRWKHKYDEPVLVRPGLTQQIPMLRQFELTKISDGIATIKFKTSILALLNDPKLQGNLVQQTPAGTIEFDIERGLIRSRKSVTQESVVNAFGPKTLLQVSGESMETLVPNDSAIKQVGFTKPTDASGK